MKKINILVFFIHLLTISNLVSQNFEKMNKSEMREQLAIYVKEIDSLKNESVFLKSTLAQKTINDSLHELKISKTELEISKLNQINSNVLEELQNCKVKIKNLELKIDSLQRAEVIVGENSEAIQNCEPSRNGFDFKYFYENANGCNPPIFQPIGWSKDGKFAYREEICNGGCGCCEQRLIVHDMKLNTMLEIPLNNVQNSDDGQVSIPTSNLQQAISNIIQTHKILAIGAGIYMNSKELPEGDLLELITTKGSYVLSIINKSGFRKNIRRGKLDEGDESYPVPPETIGLAGYFINPWNDKQLAIALIKQGWGFENETDYKVELVGISLD